MASSNYGNYSTGTAKNRPTPFAGSSALGERRLAKPGSCGRGSACDAGILAATILDCHLGGRFRRYDDVCRVFQRADRSQRIITGLADLSSAVGPLLQHTSTPCQQRYPGSLAPPHRYLHGRTEESGREPCTLAVHNPVSRSAFCGWSVCRVVTVEGRGALSSHESKQFFFLCANSYACPARDGRAGRADLRYPQID